MENPNYRKENIERKYLNKMPENQFLKVKNSLLDLEKDFIELKNRELKDNKVKIKREIEELLFKQNIASIDHMDKFEEKEMKKIRPIKNTCYNWLMNYTPEPITKIVGGFKDKTLSVFNTKTPSQTVYGRTKKLSKPKTQSKINNIRNPFILTKEKMKLKIAFGHLKKKKKERNQRKKIKN